MGNVVFRSEGRVGYLALNRPEKVNALSMDLLREFEEHVLRIARERMLRVVVVSGEGKNFSAGHDLGEILSWDPIEVERLFLQCYRVMAAIRSAPQPYIAMVRGVAAAAGCQLVAACDLAVASENARFSTPGVKIGLFCFTPMVFVSRNVSRKKAFELGFTGEFIDAREAERIGLINKVVPDDRLEEETKKLAEKIASYPLEVLESGKRFFYAQYNMDDLAALKYATEAIALHSASKHAKEGISAFLEKREPNWD